MRISKLIISAFALSPFLISNIAMANKEKLPIIGGQKDAHGCLSGAGYSWSITKKNCVRIWEAGTRLINYQSDNSDNYIIIRNGKNGPIELVGSNTDNIILNGKMPKWADKTGKYKIKIIETKNSDKTKKQKIILYKNDKAIAYNLINS